MDRNTRRLIEEMDAARRRGTPADPLSAFLRGELAAACVQPDGQARADVPRPAVLLPGSFNPLHEGHTGLAAVAEKMVGGPAAFELTVLNADKAPLPPDEVRRRLPQFAWRAPLWLTRAPTFAEKALLFMPGQLAEGIEASDDPLTAIRDSTYAASFSRRSP